MQVAVSFESMLSSLVSRWSRLMWPCKQQGLRLVFVMHHRYGIREQVSSPQCQALERALWSELQAIVTGEGRRGRPIGFAPRLAQRWAERSPSNLSRLCTALTQTWFMKILSIQKPPSPLPRSPNPSLPAFPSTDRLSQFWRNDRGASRKKLKNKKWPFTYDSQTKMSEIVLDSLFPV